MTQEEVLENVDDSLWFTAYSCALQRVGEAVHGRWWQWPRGKAWDVGVFALVRHFEMKQALSSPPPAQNFVGNFLQGVYLEKGKGA